LQRDVAIKVLPDSFAHDPDRLARFEREARALAALNHPNIAQVFGVEQSALIMELVDGLTLEDKLKQGPIETSESIRIAKQIAEALEAAHEKNIIHRDLKPANIKLTENGVVKLLDFGLAKAVDETPQPSTSNSPTLTMRATEAGLILGTAAYMSPEQTRGGHVDKRTDIWAFGVVLYEMLTGKPLFHGESVSDVLASVLRQEIDFSRLPKDAPRKLIEHCLQRDRKLRLRDIGDANFEVTGEVQPATGKRWLIPALTALAILGTASGWLLNRPKPQETLVRSFSFQAEGLSGSDFHHRAVISPNSRYVVYEAQGMLWLRDLSIETPRALPGTESGEGPFWSPDSNEIAFVAKGQLLKLAIAGTAPFPLTQAPAGYRGGAWSPDGRTIVVSTVRGIHEVSAAGGVLSQIPIGLTRLSQFRPDFDDIR